MVNLELFRDNTGLLQVAGDLAERFGAAVVGIAAGQPSKSAYGAEGLTPEVAELDRAAVALGLGEAEAQFHATLAHRVRRVAWRAEVSLAPPADYVVRQACGADLLITGVSRGRSVAGDVGRVDTGDVLMRAGRPVLVLPAGATALPARTVLVAWKDSREARLAAAAALPFLKAAGRVVVAELLHGQVRPETGAGASGVVTWLREHGVEASGVTVPANGDDAGQLQALAASEGADLMVAGAYGHSRFREWVFGGVTADFLAHAGCCALMAH